jgi:hypothetical protein
MREERWRSYEPRSGSDGLAGSPACGSRLRGKKLPSGMMTSSSLTAAHRCPALDTAQGEDAGPFDIPVLPDGNGYRAASRNSAGNAAKLV